MKVAICYDNLCTKGGHERVILTLGKALKADIFTIKYNKEKTFPEFKNFKVISNELKYNITGFRLFEIIRTFRKMDLSHYDLVISNGGWSRQVSVNSMSPPVIDYNPGPPGFLKYANAHNGLMKKIWLAYIKKLDYQAVKNVDTIIVNSNYVKNLFDHCYDVNNGMKVIYPPVGIEKFKHEKSENFFISIQRINTEKRIDLQVEIFKKLPDEKIIILGSLGDIDYFNKLQNIAPKNVEFITDVSDEKVIDLFSRCKAVIQTGKGEPFGIVPIEAMASGKPCIAVNEGGYTETILNEKTGLLIDSPYRDNFIKAIKNFDKYSFDPKACQDRAKEFSEEVFVERIKRTIENIMAK